MKKIIFGLLLAMLAPFVMKAQTPTYISKPMIQSFQSDDVYVSKAGGTFQLYFTMKAGWQNEYRNAEGLRSFIQQELNEDEISWLKLTNVSIGNGETTGRMTFTLSPGGRITTIQTATNAVTIYQTLN